MNITGANYLAAIVILILTITSFSCLGIISASFIMVFKKGDPISWIITSLSWLIGGVYYPVSILPQWLQKFSYFLPITYSLEGMRMALLQGYSFQQLLSNILALFFFTIVMLPASLYTFKFAVTKAKINGTLAQY
jgi:ABC-2 type transport system permease protein